MKLGGISFTWGIEIFSKNRVLRIFEKEGSCDYVIDERRFKLPIHPLFLLYPFLDLILFIFYFKKAWIERMISILVAQQSQISSHLPDVHVNNPFIFNFIGFFLIIAVLVGIPYLLYSVFISMKKLKYWHGLEHKLIISALNNDIDNAKKYSPVINNCGGCYLFTAMLTAFLYRTFIGIPVGLLTTVLLVIILESRYWHKYNKIGIFIGKLIQRYFTVREPHDWQLDMGIKAMRKFVVVENGR
jgi:uncharacterized protein YqhQ